MTSLSDFRPLPESPRSSKRTIYILGTGTTHHDDFPFPPYGNANDILIVCHPLTSRDACFLPQAEIRNAVSGVRQCAESTSGQKSLTVETSSRKKSVRVLMRAWRTALECDEFAIPVQGMGAVPRLSAENWRLVRPVAVRREGDEGFVPVQQQRHLREIDDKIRDTLDADAEENRESEIMAEVEVENTHGRDTDGTLVGVNHGEGVPE